MPHRLLPSDTQDATPIHLIAKPDLDAWRATRPAPEQTWLAAAGFDASLGKTIPIPGPDGGLGAIAAGWGTQETRSRDRWQFGAIAASLPPGSYRIASAHDPDTLQEATLAFLLAGYGFSRYKPAPVPEKALVTPEGLDPARLTTLAEAVALGRDLINTPAADMGPDALEKALLSLATRFSADASVTKGAELLARNFPMIHAVGRASDQAPRLIDLTWGDPEAPKVTLVGKGVCFDTGGLDIKPPASMGLMKKDMGGAANTMALAQMIMALDLPVRLRLLIPAVENSISAGAFRPGDILTSRKGLSVEVNNTDAEGRLVLADALALADEEAPELLICMATLTGAARVALGPDLPPFFTRDEALAADLTEAAAKATDPLWRLPLWPPYETLIEPEIADLDNAPSGGMAGAVTAALFLARFVENTAAFAHFDIYGWTPTPKPARPKGGAVQGPLALLSVIEKRFAGR